VLVSSGAWVQIPQQSNFFFFSSTKLKNFKTDLAMTRVDDHVLASKIDARFVPANFALFGETPVLVPALKRQKRLDEKAKKAGIFGKKIQKFGCGPSDGKGTL
jgi:hypothetical protein